jgi:hypothetical protein
MYVCMYAFNWCQQYFTCHYTWDLIGMNRASRPGQENQEEAIKYLGLLKSDIRVILDLEGTVDFSAVEQDS